MPVNAQIYAFDYQPEKPAEIPVVLIHGAGGNHLYWPAEVRRLANYRVFALDLPGHGKSGGHGEQTIAAYAAAIARWMETMELQRAFFAGHSMGGGVVLWLALHYPHLVSGLGLIATGARLPVNPALLEKTSNPGTMQSAIYDIVNWSFGPSADARLVKLAGQRFQEIRPGILHNDLLACQNFNVMNELHKIQKPTLIIGGGADKMTPPRFSQLLAAQIQDAVLEIIPEAGHMVMLEAPRQTADSLLSFLNRPVKLG